MSEALSAKRSLAMERVHKSLGAVMAERNGIMVPASYGDELFEYATVRERGAGLIDLSARGRLRVSGLEAVAFLNGLITNDMKMLAEHSWMPAVFPNVQGRLLASVRVLRLADEDGAKGPQPSFIIDTETATYERVLQTIHKFTFAGDFHVTDLTSETVLLSLQGTSASKILGNLLGATAASISETSVSEITWQNEKITVLRATHTGADGCDLIVNSGEAHHLWQSLLEAGARPIGHDALEILRVEAGIPRYGQDMDDTTVVTETNLDDAVSYTKGCYVGQEIIARIKYRGHVAKKLRGLSFEQLASVDRQAPLKSSDNKEIGLVTSTVYSPHLGQRIALGYVKYDYIAAGTEVKAGDGFTARVVELPFVRDETAMSVEDQRGL